MLKEWKSKVHFWFEDIETPMGRATDIFVVTLVFIVSTIFVVKTYYIPDPVRQMLNRVENIIIAVFVLEYILRLWSAPSKVKHFFRIYSIIDLVAIIPIFFDVDAYQILRVFRALRFLRLVRFLEGGHFFFRRLNLTQVVVIRIIYIILSIIFVSAGMIFYVENGLPDSNINTFFDAVYYSIVTLTTVGFGDITPVSGYGRLITILIILSGITFIPWQVRNLIHHMVAPSVKIALPCRSCGLSNHDTDAIYCKKCGAAL